MRDLSTIREQTFKESTITHAFAKAGVWPIDPTIAITNLRKYSKLAPIVIPAAIPASFQYSEEQLQQWKTKPPILPSSPYRQSYKNWLIGIEEAFAIGKLQKLDLTTT